MTSIVEYFDLNKRTAGGPAGKTGGPAQPAPPLEEPVSVPKEEIKTKEAAHMPLFQQIVLYFGILIGVVFSSTVLQMSSEQSVRIELSIAKILVSAIVAFVILPPAFEKLRINPVSPFLVRFGLFIQQGVFWHVLLTSIGKTIGI